MRQKEDLPFFELLNRIRIGCPSDDDIALLRSRQIDIDTSKNKIEQAANLYLDALRSNNKTLCLLPNVRSVDEFNNIICDSLEIETENILAEDCRYNKRLFKKENLNKNFKSNDTAGLEKILKIGKDSRIMLRRNIDMDKGLVNGVLGYVKNIVKNQYNYVYAIDCLFDNHSTITRIERYSAQYECQKNVYITRLQFPINLAWAITIHKSQGLSLDSVFINLDESIFESGMSYVALSRAKKLSNIFLIDFKLESLFCNDLAIKQYNELYSKSKNEFLIIKNYNSLRKGSTNDYHYDLKKEFKKVVTDLINSNNLMSTENYFLKFNNNGTNACFANVAIQALIACGPTFFEQVKNCKFINYLSFIKDFIIKDRISNS
jgi:hypothetical protein